MIRSSDFRASEPFFDKDFLDVPNPTAASRGGALFATSRSISGQLAAV